ncbi:MAG: branched-chain amino acid transaminase [Actinomycetota bacterium]|jgi:branched-chain amino acid aminotransferase|nr:branched-chain amino acid transaminase [Actinomycetota bacterium]MDQ3217200.1 branched-chain amino acid transaminase [Actinomycetota bacterium]
MPIAPVDKVWMNGELVAWENATVHVLTHALHYGSGVFEGIRCYETPRGPAVFRLREHLQRMERSAKIFMMEIPYSVDELMDATFELIKVNRLRSCYVRPIAYRGYGEMGLNPELNPVDVCIAVWGWGAYLGDDALKHGVRMTVSSWRRHDPNIIPPQAKVTGAYINSSMAKLEAVRSGFDEAIMLNPHGYVSEATGENLFVVKDGELLTPPLAAGPLPGVTRASVMAIAADLGMPVFERLMTRADLYVAEEIFCTGTAAEVTPVREIDSRVIGEPGPITLTLQQKYFDIVKGQDEKYEDWLDYVS